MTSIKRFDTIKKIEWALRIGVFMTFVGHGIFAINGKPNWIPYLEVVGISTDFSEKLIVYIGFLDLTVATFILIKPYRIIIIWAFIWAFATAIIRPIAGEPIWDFVERGTNWTAPLCLYFLMKNTLD